MLSSDNRQEMIKKMHVKNQHFALRKLSLGVASVLVGLTLTGYNVVAHADTNNPSASEQTQSTSASSTSGTTAVLQSQPTVSAQSADNEVQTDRVVESVNIYEPGNNNDTATGSASGQPDYDATIAAYNTSSNNGGHSWSPVNVSSQNIANVLAGNNFNHNGYRGHSLPAVPGYTPYLDHATVSSSSQYQNEATQLQAELSQQISNHHYAAVLPQIQVNVPLNIAFSIHYVQVSVNREIDVKVPESDGEIDVCQQNAYYYGTLNTDNMNRVLNTDGTDRWEPLSYGSESLTDALSGHNFHNAQTGYSGKTIPQFDGYTAKITGVHVRSDHEFASQAEALHTQLSAAIAADPYEIPAYTIDYPLSVVFVVTYVRNAQPGGDQPTQPGDNQPTPTEPGNNTPTDHPGQPSNPGSTTPATGNPVVNQQNNGQSQPVVQPTTTSVSHNQDAQQKLPQTGNNNDTAALTGLTLAGVAAMLGFGMKKRRN